MSKLILTLLLGMATLGAVTPTALFIRPVSPSTGIDPVDQLLRSLGSLLGNVLANILPEETVYVAITFGVQIAGIPVPKNTPSVYKPPENCSLNRVLGGVLGFVFGALLPTPLDIAAAQAAADVLNRKSMSL